jgi:SAM-dependent methyltransferase
VFTPFPFGKLCSNILLLMNLSGPAYDEIKVPDASDFQKGYVETANTMGRADCEIDRLVNKFLLYAKSHPGPKLDIGGGIGISTAEALQASADEVVALDIDIRHLLATHKLVTAQHNENPTAHSEDALKLYFGKFPKGLHFEPESFQSILMARVVHFLPPSVTVAGLRKLWDAAKPDAAIFISATTPFSKKFRHFLPEYMHRRKSYFENRKMDKHAFGKGLRFPGSTHLEMHCPSYRNECPDNLWLYEPLTLIDVVTRSGWTVVEAFTYPEPISRPENRYLGEERVGIIARKVISAPETSPSDDLMQNRNIEPIATPGQFRINYSGFQSLGYEWRRDTSQRLLLHSLSTLRQPQRQLATP